MADPRGGVGGPHFEPLDMINISYSLVRSTNINNV